MWPVVNPIVCENSRPGSPASEWEVGDGSDSIQGFTTDISANLGETIHFKIDTISAACHLDIYRMGYYEGLGARRIATIFPSVALPQIQPSCRSDEVTQLLDCGTWDESASWAIPLDAASGIYFARLVRDDSSGASHVFFVVRDDFGGSDVLFQTSDTTWQAYNDYGNRNLYHGDPPAGRAYKVSYNRPFKTRAFSPFTWVFGSEYPMVRFLEANGYSMSYASAVDTDRNGGALLSHPVFISVGHDEYWSANQRANVETARAAGKHLAFFSGNEMFWKTRFEPSIDDSATPYRTLVCYKETRAGMKIDPDPAWTGTWRDPRFSPPSDGGRPENALTGTAFMVNSEQFSALIVPAADGRMRFGRNTPVAALREGEVATLGSGCDCTVGYEWDEDLDNGFRPPGVVRLSSTSARVAWYLQDYGSTYAPGISTHHLTLYRHSSGALVFGAGTVGWSWGLDGAHDYMASTPELSLRQATINLLADMGVQPSTLQGDLVRAEPSTDTEPPSSQITSPSDGSTVPPGSSVTVIGTASDTGGGSVGGVEVSTDGGNTWHPASGRDNWRYAFTPGVYWPALIRSRAVDDSGNLETPSIGISVTVESPFGQTESGTP